MYADGVQYADGRVQRAIVVHQLHADEPITPRSARRRLGGALLGNPFGCLLSSPGWPWWVCCPLRCWQVCCMPVEDIGLACQSGHGGSFAERSVRQTRLVDGTCLRFAVRRSSSRSSSWNA